MDINGSSYQDNKIQNAKLNNFMNIHEEKIVSSFIIKEKRHRYRYILDNLKKRSKGLDRLNHCDDFIQKCTEWLSSNTCILEILQKENSPKQVYLISDVSELDGIMLPLSEAVKAVDMCGFGTIVSCIPGKLAYYYDECSERRAILRKK